jgi:hypothetical protein
VAAINFHTIEIGRPREDEDICVRNTNWRIFELSIHFLATSKDGVSGRCMSVLCAVHANTTSKRDAMRLVLSGEMIWVGATWCVA